MGKCLSNSHKHEHRNVPSPFDNKLNNPINQISKKTRYEGK